MGASFLRGHAVRVDWAERRPLEPFRSRWLAIGLPADAVDRAAEFEARWGGLVLPPAPCYEGGPRAFSVSLHGGSAEEGWWFWAGDQRFSVPFRFLVGPRGEFALEGAGRRIPLHASVDGWVESVALSYRASALAGQVTTVRGAAVEDLDLSALEPVPLTAGLADTWWQGPGLLVAVYRGEADSFANPKFLRAHLYEGMPEHAFRFDQRGPRDLRIHTSESQQPVPAQLAVLCGLSSDQTSPLTSAESALGATDPTKVP